MEESTKHENIKEIMKNLVKVENMTGNSGRDIVNQFILTGKDFSLFQSYNSPIALIKDGKTYIFSNWDYSVTTGKYRNRFLDEDKAETLKKLKSGEYIAVDFEV